MTYQLRVYTIRTGELEEWIDEWHAHVLPLRRRMGFDVVGPWVNRDDNVFVWLIGHDDLARANAEYYDSAERTSIEPDPARHVASTQTWLLDAL